MHIGANCFDSNTSHKVKPILSMVYSGDMTKMVRSVNPKQPTIVFKEIPDPSLEIIAISQATHSYPACSY